MPRKKQTDAEQPELIAEEAAEYIVSPDEEAMRAEYRQRLAEALKDPEFRQIEGFPIGEDEAILALSDPPYYTACPNPFLNEIVEKWRRERAALRDELGLPNDEPAGSKYAIRENMPTKNYHREPFAADVSEGKNDPIYNAHSYHTKVPHKAIMRYILHYTDPGDVVLDGFCGTGMTGVAAQLCGDKKAVESLGYTVKNGVVFEENNKPISNAGARKAVLIDLSPAATFISYNYNNPVNSRQFSLEVRRLLKELDKEIGWLYQTHHQNELGRINSTVWGTVFLCPQCSKEVVLWDLENKEDEESDSLKCPKCEAIFSREQLEYFVETILDRVSGKPKKRNKKIPIRINYEFNGHRYDKAPDKNDLELLQKAADLSDVPWFPNDLFLFRGEKWGDTYRAGYHLGYQRVSDFYFERVLRLLGGYYKKAQSLNGKMKQRAIALLTSVAFAATHLYKYRTTGGGQPAGNNLYIPALIKEQNFFDAIERKLEAFIVAENEKAPLSNPPLITNQSTTQIKQLHDNSIDYVFIDPPFGANIMYSESNFIWESWLQVFTQQTNEAIINKTQRKNLESYQGLMHGCFNEFYRVLKPAHWLTVEFHNSQNAIWNAIQEALMQAGFIVADVRTLDKKQGTFKQVTSEGAVKQDLVISAYKPTSEFVQRFLSEGGTEQGAWDFVRQHLEQLPLPNLKNGAIESLQERFPYLLYDRMVAFHIQRGLTVPLSAPEFYQGLSQRFLEREGMVFTAAQAAAYDKLRLQAERVEQLALFVTDESSARQWLRQELEHEPKTYGDLQPKFVQQLHQSKYEDLPELKVILEQAFLQDDKGRWYVPDPERAADLEKLRQNALLREFNEYRKSKGRLKVFRSEAVRAGFSNAWREREYDVIVEIAERMPESVLQEDQQLLMYYHNAGLRQSSQPKQENLL